MMYHVMYHVYKLQTIYQETNYGRHKRSKPAGGIFW